MGDRVREARLDRANSEFPARRQRPVLHLNVKKRHLLLQGYLTYKRTHPPRTLQ